MLTAQSAVPTPNPIMPAGAEAIWSVMSIAFSVLVAIMFVVLLVVLIRWAGFQLGFQLGRLNRHDSESMGRSRQSH